MIQNRTPHRGEELPLPREHEFTDEESELATELPEWAAVEEHRGAMRASEEVYEFVRSRIHSPTSPRDDLAPWANLEGYTERLQQLQAAGNQLRYRDAEREVELIVRARLAARRRLEQDPSYYTWAERTHAATLPGWPAFRAFADRAYDSHGHGMLPPEVEADIERRRLVLWEEARQDLRTRGGVVAR